MPFQTPAKQRNDAQCTVQAAIRLEKVPGDDKTHTRKIAHV